MIGYQVWNLQALNLLQENWVIDTIFLISTIVEDSTIVSSHWVASYSYFEIKIQKEIPKKTLCKQTHQEQFRVFMNVNYSVLP